MLKNYAADHRYLLEATARVAGFADPVAIDLDEFTDPLLKKATRGALLPLDGVLVRDWDPDNRRVSEGIRLGARLYRIDGVRFAKVAFQYDLDIHSAGLDFHVVDRRDYRKLYRIALGCRRDAEPLSLPPVLPDEQLEILRRNTIGYLEPHNLRRIKKYGGRPRRGLLLIGPPGNGKTMACRWIWEECRRRHWEWRLVTPDAYRAARQGCNPVEAVKELFTLEKRGVIFFDDMDLALRDRDTTQETDDQSVFLGALDGISVNEGVVFVFTTNCTTDLIDRAFKRPGRLDVVVRIEPPTADLRRRLIERWHEEIRQGIDSEQAVETTEGYTFAEIEELKNLLIMHHWDAGDWDWNWALQQFDSNRRDLAAKRRQVGFGASPVGRNGNLNGK
jgi:cell division protease FtsH